MEKFSGQSICGGVALGKIFFYPSDSKKPQPVIVADGAAEYHRFQMARETALRQLQELYATARGQVGEENAAIFEVHQLILEDESLNLAVEKQIREDQLCAEYAVYQAAEKQAQLFSQMQDEYLRTRAGDVRDVAERLIRILTGESTKALELQEPAIIVAEDLKPSQTIQLDRKCILAFVTIKGSQHSHAAILARTMGIPALACVNIPVERLEQLSDKEAVVDGNRGEFYVSPDENTMAAYTQKLKQQEEQKQLLKDLKGKPDITADGHPVKLFANIGGLEDLESVLENDASGIGLMRSEFLFLERDSYPTEEEQFQTYKRILSAMGEKPVIIRTLDLGADKQTGYLGLDPEENPALGCRGIRLCLSRPELFRTQLRAILRAAVYGNASLMYPMIISVEEIEQCKELVRKAEQELTEEHQAFRSIPQGIMIETPAAVMISDELARHVDFFSIGTNDLTQYTLALDRQNARLEAFYDPYHPGVMRMIQMTIENGHKAGIEVGICGELAADPKMTEKFVRAGIDELSVSPAKVLPLRRAVRDMNFL